MSFGIVFAALSMLQSPAAVEQNVDVAFEEVASQQNRAAIERIEANDSLEMDDPARLLNLGIAYAREGRAGEARSMFLAAAHSENRVRLETASGEWVDSRRLAYRALTLLDSGQISPAAQMASR